MKQLAVVVPALLDHDQRRYHFIDENGRIDGMFLTKNSEKSSFSDPMELYRQTKEDHNTRWDEKSKAEFTRAFVETPKVKFSSPALPKIIFSTLILAMAQDSSKVGW